MREFSKSEMAELREVFAEQSKKFDCFAKPESVQKMKGLGDLIAKATTAVGIKPCGGCKKRQEMLNKLVPFGSENGK